MSQLCLAHVDGNNFYASCERIFRPDLAKRPIIVLSNNDGNVVARSREAKALGVGMGVPAFQIRDVIAKHQIVVFSSNYTLYGDISGRMMSTLAEMVPQMEIYSIDEAFLDLTGMENTYELADYAFQIKERVHTWVGIPVCIGIARTKTLAKLADYAAKKYPATRGVVDLRDQDRARRLLSITPVGEVWGVGSRINARLATMGIKTALDLAEASPKEIRKRFSVTLERTLLELNGISCIDLETTPPARQQIVCSRSFGARVTERRQMLDALNNHAAQAAAKLRRHGQCARTATIFIKTSPFSTSSPFYANSATTTLPVPTDDTRDLIQCASALLGRIWREGYSYAGAGIMLSDLSPAAHGQHDLFRTGHGNKHRPELMVAMDKINKRFAAGVQFAGQGIQRKWSMKRRFLSPLYTTRWSDIPVVR